VLVEPVSLSAPVSRDPDDDHVLACALDAQAQLIVSGDRDLLDLGTFHGCTHTGTIILVPVPFTEHGAIHAAHVLNSPGAVEMGVHVVRAFVQLRESLASHDETVAAILSAIRQLMNPPVPKRRGIGFTADISESRMRPRCSHWRIVQRRSAQQRLT
jgi:hypothetical protein